HLDRPDPKRLGARIGLLAVLYTWDRPHPPPPHLHCIVPAADFLQTARAGSAAESAFLPRKVLSWRFRTLFLDMLTAAFRRGDLSFHGSASRIWPIRPLRPLRRTSVESQVGRLRQAYLRQS
ncbi:MAG: transposase, partial [Blastocatellia bacterium]|nr:transposase [Blastocatellia bacterium]